MQQAKPHALLGLLCLIVMGPSQAEPWRTSGALYGQLAGISGEAGIGPYVSQIDVGFADVLEHLDVAGMLVTRTESDAFALMLHALFIGLEGTSQTPGDVLYDVEITQDLVEAAWSWRLDERYELFVGARYQSLGSRLRISAASASIDTSQNERWVDPIVGGRGAWQLSDSTTLSAAVDVGGFGVGSKLTWSGLLALDWSFSESMGAVLGYRVLDTDYETGEGNRRFVSNARVAGPLLGIRFNFY